MLESIVVAVVSVIVSSPALVNGDPSYAPVIKTESGPVRGSVILDGRVHFYQDIRYGHAERFARPVPVEPWSEIYDATKKRDLCPTLNDGTNWQGQGEDCLFVRVWRPANLTGVARVAAMVFIHGGAFQFYPYPGQTDGDLLAAEGQVVVFAIQYRLGPLGFLYAKQTAQGNQGLLDQILALQWIRQNVHHFGADPDLITLFGQSAGSMSVSAMIMSPLTDNGQLFRRAILQSGYPVRWMGATPADVAWQQTMRLARRLKCDNRNSTESIMQCLRGKPFWQICQISPHEPLNLFSYQMMTPMFGDQVLPDDPANLATLARAVKRKNLDSILYGVVRNEGSLFIGMAVPEIVKPDVRFHKRSQVRHIMMQLLQSYQITDPGPVADFYLKRIKDISYVDSVRVVLSDMYGDFILACPVWLADQEMAKVLPASSYAYRFDQVARLTPQIGCAQQWQGVCHGYDTYVLFGNPLKMAPDEQHPDEMELSHQMMETWTRFAKTGRPKTMGTVKWLPAIGEGNSIRYMSIGKQMAMTTGTDHPEAAVSACQTLWKRRLFFSSPPRTMNSWKNYFL